MVSNAVEARIWSYYRLPFQILHLFVWGRVLNDGHKTKHRSPLIHRQSRRPGGLWWAKPPQIEIWNTMYYWSCVNFYNVKTPVENFLATVLFPGMTWEYTFQTLFPESQTLCVENKHESLTEWLTGWNCLSFFKNKNLNTLCIPSSKHLSPLFQFYADLYEIIFRFSTNSANHFK